MAGRQIRKAVAKNIAVEMSGDDYDAPRHAGKNHPLVRLWAGKTANANPKGASRPHNLNTNQFGKGK